MTGLIEGDEIVSVLTAMQLALWQRWFSDGDGT